MVFYHAFVFFEFCFAGVKGKPQGRPFLLCWRGGSGGPPNRAIQMLRQMVGPARFRQESPVGVPREFIDQKKAGPAVRGTRRRVAQSKDRGFFAKVSMGSRSEASPASIWLRFFFPLLALQGIYHYWT